MESQAQAAIAAGLKQEAKIKKNQAKLQLIQASREVAAKKNQNKGEGEEVALGLDKSDSEKAVSNLQSDAESSAGENERDDSFQPSGFLDT